MSDHIRDEVANLPLVDGHQVYEGRVWNLRSEEVDLGSAGKVRREFIEHTGAVVVLALREDNHVLVLKQYRHPVNSFLWELPAGLLDIPGEPWHIAAARELAEEADLEAATWHTLVDYYTSPGGSDEFIRIFLARNLTYVPEHLRHARTDEEADMIPHWLPLDEAVDKVLGGEFHNGATALGILAAHESQRNNWDSLRSISAPFELKASRQH